MNPAPDMLSLLIGGMSKTEFEAVYWRKRFLFVPGAARSLLEGLPDRARVEELIQGPRIRESDGVRYLSFPSSGSEPYAAWWTRGARGGGFDPAEPINIPRADRFLPELVELRETLESSFRASVNLQLFCGRRGAQIRAHSDLPDSVVIQIEGQKRWRVQDREGDYLPDGNSAAELDDASVEIEMAPGDVLYKPSHGAHATTCLDDSLSVTASPETWTLADAAMRFIESRMAFDQVWRTQLPLDPSSGPEVRQNVSLALREIADLLPDATELETFVSRSRSFRRG